MTQNNLMGITSDGQEYFVVTAPPPPPKPVLEIMLSLEDAKETLEMLQEPGAVAIVEQHSPGLVDKFLREGRHLQRVGAAVISSYGYRWDPD